ncbi:hypothetical protein ACP70R_049166 [Stipagrostis hirtigluma subsp. patula]
MLQAEAQQSPPILLPSPPTDGPHLTVAGLPCPRIHKLLLLLLLASVPGSLPLLLPRPSLPTYGDPSRIDLSVLGDVGCRWWGTGKKMILPTRSMLESSNGAPSGRLVKKRKIVEHIILLRAKPNISDDEEKDMLDYLYTSQYQMRGILAISLGRIEDPNSENFTHAVFMRFQQGEDIAKFQSSSYYSKILDEHIKPVSYGSVSVDFESEVEDDIIPLFRRGEDFNYGVEFMLLISFMETAPREAMEDALASLQKLLTQCSSFIVQATFDILCQCFVQNLKELFVPAYFYFVSGCCLNHMDNGYNHGAVIRFASLDDFKLFRDSKEYNNMWASKFQPIVEKSLQLHFTVDPVGNQLM